MAAYSEILYHSGAECDNFLFLLKAANFLAITRLARPNADLLCHRTSGDDVVLLICIAKFSFYR
jgi:hypothetical protein